MKVLTAGYEILTPISEGGIEELKHIELIARECYKSLDKITDDGESAKKFVKGLIDADHCFDGETEVLTIDGWVKWKDYNGSDIAVVNEDLTFKGFEKPLNVIHNKYKGDFYKYPTLGIEVTDKHRMLGMFANTSKERSSKFCPQIFMPGCPYNNYHKGSKKTLGERFFRTISCCEFDNSAKDPYYILLGFWIGDGAYVSYSKDYICFHIKKERKVKFLEQLCSQLGAQMQLLKGNKIKIIYPNIGVDFNSYYNSIKYLPKYKDVPMSLEQINSIIIGLIESDGSKGSTGIKISTTSIYVADWLECNAPLCGYNISKGKIVTNENDDSRIPLYNYFLLKTKYRLNNDSRKPQDSVIVLNKEDDCYCATTSTGLLMVRGTNGVITISGNCAMIEHSTLSVKFMVDRGVTHEIVRHRIASYAQESTRYVNYSKDKYGNEIKVIDISNGIHLDNKMSNLNADTIAQIYGEWWSAMEDAEKHYMKMIELGATPQIARRVLPNSTATTLTMTANYREWRAFFKLRTAQGAHPQMREIACALLADLKTKLPIIFDDIE